MLDRANGYIWAGMLMGTIMFLNVWIIIWPAQKIVCGIEEGDAAVAGPKALLASRTNTVLSAPMLFFMGASTHLSGSAAAPVGGEAGLGVGFMVVMALIMAVEANGLFGKLGPLTTVKGVIHSSLGLTAIMYGLSLI
ncbi:MAG: urate hydroxylase PuuD [Pseudomonadales bacterium]|nr:urate hydroxylase PuuD [Pseudomonadales bacterium]